jgi:pyruvate/2-oxoacid:ferredoxin oxidoreductase beta subunit
MLEASTCAGCGLLPAHYVIETELSGISGAKALACTPAGCSEAGVVQCSLAQQTADPDVNPHKLNVLHGRSTRVALHAILIWHDNAR